MPGEFDFSIPDFNFGGGDSGLSGFGDLSNFSLGGQSATGPAFSSDLGLGGVGDPLQFSDPGPAGGDPSGFQQVSNAVRGGLGTVAEGAKAVSPIVALGTAGVGLAGGIQAANTSAQQARLARQAQGMQKQTLQAQQAAAAPLTQFGTQELQQAGAGQIPPAIQAKIDAWATGAKAKAADFAARSGQGNSTMLTQWNQWIDQQAQAMAADYLQQQQQLGVQSLSQGASALSGAGQNAASLQAGAANQQGGIAALMDAANKALASLSAGAA